MAQKVSVQIVDDIDGGEATQTVPFALDGVTYEIDLSDDNAGALREELERFIDASRRVGGRKVKVATGQSTVAGGAAKPTDRERNQQVRAWASANGYAIAERGRIPNEIYEAFDNAESAPAEPVAEEAPVKRKRAPRKKS
ncbi:nucleoid-associated protein Lsr2 [Amycolatopsis sp. WAC 01375]|uniref:histone-like nucleoid-structuring protein Lsr2 n=1 Tax=unclassified Amycolatopsis TaxID=2618356 RepID=UPI000F7A2396|nr:MULTISPECIES: Lsr2 family protein [unclassified Amycolatopsis]RSM57149.1 nucleoid-associated protein Lsr2 [Amycolatopsis sp. WAC 01376]RSM70404.1 nucleoid-associated protein Lsr2 [Amycolatopsis sp. WAC 01375]RSN29423.1 nucleoid-associated protein Lsr2 [Amycolatopsis sp. WAC 01416]